jgi:UDP-N-acetylglucosamine acyltransferase
VTIEAGVRLLAQVHVTGWTHIEAGVEIHPFAAIGGPPQDKAYTGAETYVRIGADTVLREGVTVHRGTPPGSTTSVGKRCLLMALAHIGHNSQVGDDVVIVNGCVLGGHAQVGPRAFLGGGAAIHQFVRIGALAMLAGNDTLLRDVPPFMMTDRHGRIAGINVLGLRRAGVSREERAEIQAAHRLLYRSGLLFRDAMARLADMVQTPSGRAILAFVREPSRRGFTGGTRSGAGPHGDAEPQE